MVIGASDPNPAVDGRGIAVLRAAGIDVVVDDGPLHGLCEQLNEPFARFIREGLPFITFKAAVSLDGKVAAAGGDARWISSPASRRQVHAMRAAADAVMVGAGTARRDDPRLTARDAEGPDPVRVVVSRGGDLPLESQLVATATEAPTILLTRAIAPDAARTLDRARRRDRAGRRPARPAWRRSPRAASSRSSSKAGPRWPARSSTRD